MLSPSAKPTVGALPAGSPRPDGVAQPPASASAARLVRYPCGHTDSEEHLAGKTRELKNALWVGCPHCNVITVIVAIIETQ
ncbi:MAG: hypothetical protein DME00_10280 [Candidatus Rokuibacteriota bacterium]|nr:MAG: hypothetical protein DME00_10280 [Candidatus Rokubacteria bacterium]